MEKHREEHRVARMCSVIEVSRAGYYAWRRRPQSARSRANEALSSEIAEIFDDSDQTYGAIRVHRTLRKRGDRVGLHRVARLMRERGLRVHRRRRYRPTTTDSKHDHPIAPNRLQRDFTATRINERWVGDLTYIETGEGWLYLAVVLDLFSRRIVGWDTSRRTDGALTLSALRAALARRQPGPGLLHHTDRGSQYAAIDYRLELDGAEAIASMSRKGDCYDNAAMESFFATLKRELVHRRRWATRDDARAALFEWIEGRYNRIRLHSTLDYCSPAEYEEEASLTSTPCPLNRG